jgi:hypothetical protein
MIVGRPLPKEMTKPDYFAFADAVSFWKRGSLIAFSLGEQFAR